MKIGCLLYFRCFYCTRVLLKLYVEGLECSVAKKALKVELNIDEYYGRHFF